MFADDTLVYNTKCGGKKAHSQGAVCCPLQADANAISTWASKWNTIFNAAMSAELMFHRSSTAPDVAGATIPFGGLPVPSPSSVRHLGGVLSSSLSWSAHIASLGRQVGWKVSLLKSLAFRANIPLYVLSLLYKTLVHPCMEYASSVWDNCSAADSATLEPLELSLSYVFLSVHFGSSYVSQLSKSQRLHLLCWPTLSESWRRRRQKLILLWQLKNGFGPSSLSAQLPAAVSARCHYA